jgi:uncharacterized membrane protein YphA (DoxX/SURF4 family)
MSSTSIPSPSVAAKTIAVTRIITGVFFLFFGEYKIAGPAFAYGGFAGWIRGFLDQDQVVGFYRGFLSGFVMAHPVLCARIVGWGELAIGLSLVLGLWVRPASIAGIVEMISLVLSTWYGPGHHAPAWQYFGAELDHLPLILLFAIFFAARAGEVWGVDGLIRARASTY